MIDPPDKIRGFRSKSINALIDAVTALTPRNSQTIGHAVSPSGTTSQALGLDEKLFDHPSFEVERSGAATVRVRGGSWERVVANTLTRLPLTTDSGTDYKSATWKTLTISESCYVCAVLDDPDVPTTLTAGLVTAWPTNVWSVEWPLAYVEFAGSIVTRVWQLWSGDIRQYAAQLDGKSLNFSAGLSQVYGYATASSSAPAPTDLFPYKDASADTMAWCTMADLMTSVIGVGGPWGGGNAPWQSASAVSHHNLSGRNDGTDDADHNWAWCNAQTGYDATYARNYGASIGNSSAQLSIDLDNSALYTAGNAALNWYNRTLGNGDWRLPTDNFEVVAGVYKHNSLSGITLGSSISGGIVVGGSLQRLADLDPLTTYIWVP